MNALRILFRIFLGAVLVGLVVFAWNGLRPTPSGDVAADQLWTCSMHPQIRLPKPGDCPICGMDLIRVSDLAVEQQEVIRRAGIQTEPVRERDLFKEIRTVGKLDYNERRVAYISARVAGRVDRVHADFTGMVVKKGDHLVNLYSPDLYAAQRELLLALDSQKAEKPDGAKAFTLEGASLLESARAKLLLWGLLPEQIREIESTRKLRTHLTIYSPIGGVVIEKMIREGQYVKDGDPLHRIADLDPIWLYLNVYEFDLAWIRYGQAVDVRVEAYPGEVFKGTVVFIDPFLDDATRTVKVRVNLKNADRRLKPQMYANASILVKIQADGKPAETGLEGKFTCPMHPEVVEPNAGECPVCGMKLEQIPPLPKPAGSPKGLPAQHAAHDAHAHHDHGHAAVAKSPEVKKETGVGVLAIPVSSVLDTGRRQIAFRQTASGSFELVELRLGPRCQAKSADGSIREYYPVLSGLRSGDKVVVQGGFLLDSQRQIEGMPSLLFPEGVSGANAGHAGHAGHGAPATKSEATPAAGHQH